MFVDSDDYVDSRFVEIPLKTILQTKADIVIFGVTFFNNNLFNNSNHLNFALQHFITEGNSVQAINIHTSVWNKLFKKEFLTKHSITFIPHLTVAEDNVFNLECLICKASYSPILDNLYYYYANRKDSATSNKSYPSILAVYHTYATFVKTNRFTQMNAELRAKTLKQFCQAVLAYRNISANFQEDLDLIPLMKQTTQFIKANFDEQDFKYIHKYLDMFSANSFNFVISGIWYRFVRSIAKLYKIHILKQPLLPI